LHTDEGDYNSLGGTYQQVNSLIGKWNRELWNIEQIAVKSPFPTTSPPRFSTRLVPFADSWNRLQMANPQGSLSLYPALIFLPWWY
jgi:hypothetical protein